MIYERVGAGELRARARELGMLFLALVANAPDETLRHDGPRGRRNEERFHTDVDQSRDRARRVVRVKRAEHEVARQGSVDGDFRRFHVANLTDHDDGVGVRVGEEQLQHVDKFGSLDRITADADGGRLPKACI